MRVTKADCRDRFTVADLEFAVTVLGNQPGDRKPLEQLVTDAACRDQLLDDDRLFRALLERPALLSVSPQFYFFVLVRQVLRAAGIHEIAVADYVASVLVDLARAENGRFTPSGGNRPLEYCFELLGAMNDATGTSRFAAAVHLGNRALFLSGILREHVRARARRTGAPGIGYYEAMGRSGYLAASRHQLAGRYQLEDVFAELADRFHTTRRALNDLSERLFSLGDGAAGGEMLERLARN